MEKHFVHPNAIVESENVGPGTRIWAHAHVLKGAKIGAGCNVCDGVFVENDVIVGDRVTIKCGVQLWDGVRLEDDVFVGPNATFTNDPYPRSKQYPAHFPQTIVRRGASIGANATILPGVTIGRHAMVGAGAVVTRSVPPYAVVLGNPARVVRFDSSPGLRTESKVTSSHDTEGPIGVRYISGTATPSGEIAEWLVRELPSPLAHMMVASSSSKHLQHACASMASQRIFWAARGAVQVFCDDGNERRTFAVDRPTTALYVPAAIWCVPHAPSPEALVLILASTEPAHAEIVSDYEDYVAVRRSV